MVDLAFEVAQSAVLLAVLLCLLLLLRRRDRPPAAVAGARPVAPPATNDAIHGAGEPLGEVLEIAAGAIISIDSSRRICLFSPGAQLIFGYRADEVLGQPVDMLLPERLRAAHARHVEAFAAAPEASRTMSVSGEVTALRKDGTEFAAESWICKFVSAGRRIFIVLMRDVSDYTRTEPAQREKEQQLRLVTDHLPAMILYVDTEWHYGYVNQAAEDWYDRPASEIIGRTLEEVLGVGAADKIRSQIERAWNGAPHSFDEVITYPDGVTRDVTISWVPHMADDGAALGFFAITQDMTEHRRMQQHLAQSEKMDAVGELSGGIAHEYNNLLMVIDGYSHRAMQKLDDRETAEKSLVEVFKATERAARLTKQMLAFSRRQIMERNIFGVAKALEEVENLLRASLEQRHELRLEPEDGGACIETDAAEFDQAVINLVLNARDAMPEGGVITVASRLVAVDETTADEHPGLAPGRYVEITVADQGHGIDAKTLPRVFEPFFTDKEQGKGTGLGLSMVYGFAQQSGGAADIHSTSGEGTTVRILLPAAEREPAAAPRASRPDGHRGRETILVVEDDELLLALTRGTLTELGYSVATAVDGLDALKVSRNHDGRIDLLLSDIVMPGLSGLEAAALIRESRPDIKIVFLTGHANRGRPADAPLPRGAQVLQKPLQMDYLASVVRSVLDEDPADRPSALTG